jgi:hypothetical protein
MSIEVVDVRQRKMKQGEDDIDIEKIMIDEGRESGGREEERWGWSAPGRSPLIAAEGQKQAERSPLDQLTRTDR